MKQQYESEILFHLMERDGFNIPSSVPPYEAEIKAYLINQVKQAYPKLTDYEAEWLLYNYTKHLPADFPISSVTNVTEATFENVVPFAYKSAILKGNTLVNLVNYSDATVNINSKYVQIASLVYSTIGKPITLINFSDKVITFQVTANGTFKETVSINANSKTVITLSDGEEIKNIRGSQNNGWEINETSLNELKLGLMVIDGDYTNVDIPYFTGMQSVKVPVLTTTGKNLLNPSWEKKYGKFYPFKLKKGTTLTLSTKDSTPSLGGNLLFTTVSGGEKWFPIEAGVMKNTITLEEDVYQVNNILTGDIEYQLELGSNATSYEPYKSNILRTPEEVVLRSLPNGVKDTLNLITGEYVQRIGEITLNGSETNWFVTNQTGWESTPNTIAFGQSFTPQAKAYNASEISSVICDKFATITGNGTWGASGRDEAGVSINQSNRFDIRIERTKLSDESLTAFKQWLSQNPITVQYEFETPIVKTVELKTVNESGESIYFMPLEGTMYIHSDGTPLKPTITMEIPVEATTQNLASFIDLEVEE